MSTQITTRDIGFLIRDAVELMQEPIDRVDGNGDSQESDVFVEGVDVSDVDNPKIYLSNGQVFTIRIIAGVR